MFVCLHRCMLQNMYIWRTHSKSALHALFHILLIWDSYPRPSPLLQFATVLWIIDKHPIESNIFFFFFFLFFLLPSGFPDNFQVELLMFSCRLLWLLRSIAVFLIYTVYSNCYVTDVWFCLKTISEHSY